MRQDTVQDSTNHKSSNKATVYEAAAALNVTVDAVRKRIQRGTIPHEKHADGRVYVLLDEVRKVQDKGHDKYQTSRDELVDNLRDQVEYLRGELATRSEELRRKDHIIAALAERIPELPSGRAQDAANGTETASEASAEADTFRNDERSHEGVQRSWWRRLLDI